MGYTTNQKRNYLSELKTCFAGLLDFIDDWPELKEEYTRAGLSDSLADDDLSGSIFEGTTAAEAKTTVVTGDHIYNGIMALNEISGHRGNLETLARRR